MRIRYLHKERLWIVLELETNAIIGTFKTIEVNVPCILANTDNGLTGTCVVAGKLRKEGDTAFIEKG